MTALKNTQNNLFIELNKQYSASNNLKIKFLGDEAEYDIASDNTTTYYNITIDDDFNGVVWVQEQSDGDTWLLLKDSVDRISDEIDFLDENDELAIIEMIQHYNSSWNNNSRA